MNVSDLLLEQWERQVKELFPQLHQYQQETLAFVVQSLVQSGTAVMQRVAESAWEYLSTSTKMTSMERRLQRFVANERIEVDACWKQFLTEVLAFWQHKPVTLVLDLTPYHCSATSVYVGLLVHKRTLPLAWRVMPQQESWEQSQWDIVARLFADVAASLETSDCTLLADRGLSCLQLIQACEQVGWHYVLRIKNEEWMRRAFRQVDRDWQQGKQFILKEGQHWYGKVFLWQEHGFACFVSASWEPGYDEAWFLISDRKASPKRIGQYAQRMRVEADFEDQKSRGCFIENSRFLNREHLHRWLFAVYLALWWSLHLGMSCMHHGHRGQVDRTDRRDKGLVRIGRLWLKAILKKAAHDVGPQTLNRVKAQLANCLPFSHRNRRLSFSIYLH